MARDSKLVFTWTTASATTSTFGLTASTPTGDKANSQVVATLALSGSGTATGVVSNTLNLGFRNSTMDTSSFANWIAGNEVTAIANDPPVWGNTSTAEMYARGIIQLSTSGPAATASLAGASNPRMIVEGALDTGSGSVNANTWSQISGAVPLMDQVNTTYSAITAAANPQVTTAAAHGLQVGDYVALSGIGGLTGIATNALVRVSAVGSSTTFNISNLDASTLTTAGTAVTGATSSFFKLRFTPQNGAGFLFSIPLIESIRPYLRLTLKYDYTQSGTLSNPTTLTIARAGLVTGRENAPRD